MFIVWRAQPSESSRSRAARSRPGPDCRGHGSRLGHQFARGAHGVVGGDQLATLTLQPRDGVVPGADQLGTG
jgi:hypothetical protein